MRPGCSARLAKRSSDESGAGDLELARAAERGDPAASRALVELLFDRVRRTASYILGPNQDAEDLAQRALIQILRAIGTFRGQCALEYWAKQITVRMAFHEIKKRRHREALAEKHWEDPAHAVSDDEEAFRYGVRARLAALLQELPEDQRFVLVLHHIEGYGVAEIAEMTGARVNTVRGRLRAGRRKMKDMMNRDEVFTNWHDGSGGAR